MNEKTLTQIILDFGFLIKNEKLSTLNEIVTSLNTYLFALAQHGVIDSTDYKVIGNIMLKYAIETAKELMEKRNVNTEESPQKNGEEKC
jgi:hypothetical protein